MDSSEGSPGDKERGNESNVVPAGAGACDEAFHDLWGDTTGYSADLFLVRHQVLLSRLGKRTTAMLSYRIGMTDIIRSIVSTLGKEAARQVLEDLAEKSKKKPLKPDFEYVDDEDEPGDDTWEDEEEDDEGRMGVHEFLRRQMDNRRRRRRSRSKDKDPMFG